MRIPSSKTEHRAVDAIKAIIDEHSTMEHQINENDKEMSWDGYIWLSKKNNGDQSKPNFDARVPVQIKGHNNFEHKYTKDTRISYPVKLDDLRVYATEKGVLYFQVFVDGKNSDIFYASLYPSKIADYLDNAEENGNTATISISFTRIEKNPDKFYIIAKQFSDEAKKQGSAYTPLVQDRIRSVDFDKLTSINLSIVGARDPFSVLARLSSGDICLYGKTENDKYFRPLQGYDKTTFYAGRDVSQTISINNEIFYTQYRGIVDSNGGITLIPSPNLAIKLPEGRFNYRVKSTIKDLSHDARFLLKLKEAKSFEIHGHSVKLSDPRYTPDFEIKLKYIVDLYETLEMIGFDTNTKFSQYTDEQQLQLAKLVELRSGKYNNQFKEDFCRYNWMLGGKYYPLLMCNKNGCVELASSLYTKKYIIYLPSEDPSLGKEYKMPLFLAHEIEVLSNLYFCDYNAFYQQIDESVINNATANALLEGALNMICVYDKNADELFLDLADYLLEQVKPYIHKDLITLNKLQIKKRRSDLSSDESSAICSISSDDVQVLFGKSVLLGNRKDAEMYYDRFTKEEQERYKQLPIYELYRQLQQ